MKYFLLIFLSGLIFSCTGNDDLPNGILKPQKMQDVFWDYIRADIYASDFIKKDSSRTTIIENLRLQDKLFKLHHTTREEFYKSYVYYSNHKELMTNMIDSMIAKKQREKIKIAPVLNSN